MKLCTLDFETYYDRQFSLSKITTEHYIRDPRFQTIGLGVKWGTAPTEWVEGPKRVEEMLRDTDFSNIFVVAQNAVFDAGILSFRYGVKPGGLGDTLGMSRALFPHEKSHSLKAQAERMGIGQKGTEVENALGKRYEDFSREEIDRYGEYCINDVDLTYTLFNKYMELGFPKQELRLIDLTLRMFTEPVLQLDEAKLKDHLHNVVTHKQELLESVRDAMLQGGDPDFIREVFASGLDGIKKLLMSNDKFADVLRKYGVEPPRKISATTGKEAYAFAKTDEAFKALEEHDNVDVQVLVGARLGTKTTLEETRTQRFIDMASRGVFPVPLRYFGAHSGRWCLTGDHEVLTPAGWVRLDAWNGQPIRQWDSKTKGISWAERPIVSSFETTAPLVEFSSKYHRALYTEEHRIPVRKRRTEDTVKDIVAGRLAERVKNEMYVSGYAIQDSPSRNHTMLRLIVAMHADGHNVQDSKNNIVRFRFVRGRKIARLCMLLEVMGIAYTKTSYPSEPHVSVIIIRGADAPDWLRSAKHLPDWFYELGGEDAAVVVSELQHWDGSMASENNFEWCGKDSDAAVKYATLGHLCGYRVLTRLKSRAAQGWSDSWSLRFTKTTTLTEGAANARLVPYAGQVYCPTVPTGYFLCRRQDTIFLTGNSGQDSVNLQNLPSRGPYAKKLKQAIIAPDDHVVIDCDSSQIEARTLAWLAGQHDLVEAFEKKQDVYKLMASQIYGVPVGEVDATQRQVGKSVVLGAGYGVGSVKLQMFLKTQAKVEVSDAEAKRIIDTYRRAYYRIPELWKRAQQALEYMYAGQSLQIDVPGLAIAVPGKGITLPNQLHIQYPNLRTIVNDKGKQEWVYTTKGLPTRVYGGLVTENICQAVARCVVAEQMLRISKRYKVVLTVHDAVAVVAHKDEAEQAQAFVEECMSWRPKWAQDLPLACEAGSGASYGDC